MSGLLKKWITLLICILLVFSFTFINAYADTSDPNGGTNNPDQNVGADAPNIDAPDANAPDADAPDADAPDADADTPDDEDADTPDDEDADTPDDEDEDTPDEEDSDADVPETTETVSFVLRNGAKHSSYSDLESSGVVYTLIKAGKLVMTDHSEILGQVDSGWVFTDSEGKELFLYDEESDQIAYLMDYHDISYNITDEVRAEMQKDILENGNYDQDFKDAVQEIIDNYKTVKLVFGPTVAITVNTDGLGSVASAYEDEELSYDEEDMITSAILVYAGKYRFVAVPEEGWEFVKWTKDGEDYSYNAEITYTLVDEDTEFIAVFEPIGGYDIESSDYPMAAGGDGAVKDYDKDYSKEVPKTGDTSGIEYYVLLMVLGIAALCGTLAVKKK